MKLPALNQVEGVALIGVIALAGYVAYRVYKSGGNIADTIKIDLSKAWDSVSSSTNDLLHNVKSETPEQAAESMRQIRNTERSTATDSASTGQDSQGVSDGTTDVYDPMTGVKIFGYDSKVRSADQQLTSPDALFTGGATGEW